VSDIPRVVGSRHLRHQTNASPRLSARFAGPGRAGEAPLSRNDFAQPPGATADEPAMRAQALLPFFILVLAGCSSSSSSADDPNESTARPAGCERNHCDVDYDRCQATERDRCAECNAGCAGLSNEYAFECLSICRDICSSPSTSTCETTRDSCVRTARNAVCTDGMDVNDLPKSPSWYHSFQSPADAHQGACTPDALKEFDEACSSEKSSKSACQAFSKAHSACNRCIVSDALTSAWGPLLVDSSGRSWVNTEGCVARVAGDETCATKVYEANTCLSRCNEASDREACLAFARANDCKKALSEAESCAAKLGVGSSPAYAPCGPAIGDATAEILMSVIGFFCGST
jgi:hypothetical protein